MATPPQVAALVDRFSQVLPLHWTLKNGVADGPWKQHHYKGVCREAALMNPVTGFEVQLVCSVAGVVLPPPPRLCCGVIIDPPSSCRAAALF